MLFESIKIDDIASGRIEADAIYQELDSLKLEINVLRNEMSTFIKTLATISDDSSQQDYYNNIQKKILAVREAITQYCVQYNRLIPVLNLTQVKLGQDVEIRNGQLSTSPQKDAT